MRAGKLDTLVTFEERDEQQNASGQSVEVWKPVEGLEDIFAQVLNRGSRKVEAAQQSIPTVTHAVTVRYIPEAAIHLLTRMRIRIGKRILRIDAPPTNSYEQNREQMFFCTEIIQTHN